MAYLITPADRASFRRCLRQWDFGAAGRRNLEPAEPPAVPDLGLAFCEALDIYYFPGMWDWQPQVTRPLVYQGLERSLARQRERCGAAGPAVAWEGELEQGRRLLDRYLDWAPGVDRFSPVQVQPEFEVDIVDPGPPQRGLVTAGGELIRYVGTVDMLAVDAHDAYWIVRHRLVTGGWPPTQALVDDEEAVTACWAWEQSYLGMAITGTIYNEIRSAVPPGAEQEPAPPGRRRAGVLSWLPWSRDDRPHRPVRQHEPSGGGRSIPQHRRLYATAREPARQDRIEQHVAANFRRTLVRRSRAEVAEAARRLAADAARMADPGTSAEPSPSDENCSACVFAAPCEEVFTGREPEAALRSGYRRRPAQRPVEGRLGGGAWGFGRGAAPPKFRGGS
jgi:hypothetical protein